MKSKFNKSPSKRKSDKFPKKDTGKKMTEAKREQAIVDLFVKIIVQNTLKEFYEKNKDSLREETK